MDTDVPRIAWITVAPVKGLALTHVDEVSVERHGVTGNRALHLIDGAGRLVNGKRLGALVQVAAELDTGARALRLRFPDGSEAAGAVELGEEVTTSFYGRAVRGRLVLGPFAGALSAFAGEPLRLVAADEPGAGVDRGAERGSVTLLGTGSLGRLAEVSGVEAVDPRRFRMLFGIEGVEAHAEDGWVGRDVVLGEAVVRVVGHVGRCVVTTRDPDTGTADLDTLRALRAYRGHLEASEPLPFGVVGSVVAPGRVRCRDVVGVLGAAV